MPERHAIYYAPSAQSALWRRAAQWLGRDARGTAPIAADIAGLTAARRLELTASARRYGFHGTLKAPFHLPPERSADDLEAALVAFGLAHRPVPLGRLEVRLLGGFLALMPVAQSDALRDFAAEAVLAFEPFRAPLAPADRDQRLALGLTDRQVELLDGYGYPYVLEEFIFHMTIGDRAPEDEREALMQAAVDWFAPVLDEPLTLDRLTLFHEPRPKADFVRLGDFPLLSQARV